jgi:hypothetical protein
MASEARHPQELRMETEKVVLEDPEVQAVVDDLAAALADGRISEADAAALGTWQAQLAEARACLAKLLVLLESHEANRQPLLTAALTWAVLDAKLPVATELRPGWIRGEGQDPAGEQPPPPAAPHLWALTPQPEEVLPAARAVWGEDHPRAAPLLSTTLGGFPVSHLVDALVLGRGLKAGKHSAPLPGPEQWTLMPPAEDIYVRGGGEGGEEALIKELRPEIKALIGRHATTREQQIQFENLRYVAEHPEDYLRWAVPTEARDFLYPLIRNGVFKEDPTRIEYIRIDEQEVQRIIRVQEQARAEAAKAGAATPNP